MSGSQSTLPRFWSPVISIISPIFAHPMLATIQKRKPSVMAGRGCPEDRFMLPAQLECPVRQLVGVWCFESGTLSFDRRCRNARRLRSAPPKSLRRQAEIIQNARWRFLTQGDTRDPPHLSVDDRREERSRARGGRVKTREKREVVNRDTPGHSPHGWRDNSGTGGQVLRLEPVMNFPRRDGL
jgi:hypothetical protein